MLYLLRYGLCGFLLGSCFLARGQRQYASHSVLNSGSWFQISVERDGVYRVDRAFLNSLGLNQAEMPSTAIRLFGNGAAMLPEDNASSRADDLVELAIKVEDGGDGVFDGSDYFLFYGQGPDTWQKDSARAGFRHVRNLYNRRNYYYITVGGIGRRVTRQAASPPAAQTISSYNGRSFHELDTVNFLASGKEWYGEEFADAPGKTVTRSFSAGSSSTLTGSVARLRLSVIARSVGAASRFDIRYNGNLASLSVLPTGAGQYDAFAREATADFEFPAGSDGFQLQFVPGSFNAQGWLNYWEWFDRRRLAINGNQQLDFRDWTSVGSGNGRFEIEGAPANMQIWEITNPVAPNEMLLTTSSSGVWFTNDCSRLREYRAFHPSQTPAPAAHGAVPNQNLHAAPQADYLIVYHPSLLPSAQQIAEFHRQQQSLSVQLASTSQIYNEFSGGRTDPAAIRDFVKMYYDKYAGDPSSRPRYLLLLGDGSYDYFDRLPGNSQLVPAWQNNFALDVLASYTSDDFYGFLEDDEDIQSGAVVNDLDIGIGRIPAKTNQDAAQYVDKLKRYSSAASLGAWRTRLGFVADDEDQNAHFNDAEAISAEAAQNAPAFDVQKVYLDAYPQESSASGNAYPLVNQAIANQLNNGNLIWNYTGHGGPRRLADETIVDESLAATWQNENNLPLLLTATCDFAPFDNPLVPSLGEQLLMRPRTGAIALMTTTRIVFSYSNRIMNSNYLRSALQPDANGQFPRLGDAVREAKNFTYLNSTDIANNRKFTLLGDPALRLAFPQHRVRLTEVNGQPLQQADTLKASSKITLAGEITDLSGQLLESFNGTATIVVYDKINEQFTRANDAGSSRAAFQSWNQVLFRGRASASNGKFTVSFKVPRDIRYQPGAGRVSVYAENGSEDAMGMESGLIVGGSTIDTEGDREGPNIKVYLNDTRFVPGSISNERPVLIAELTDSSGINTLGSGIGHDLTVMIDNDPDQIFVLNSWYEAEKDDYQRGKIRYQLPELAAGPHVLTVKAWDVVNNPGEAALDFVVANDEKLVLDHVLNYPNPFTTHTSFWFEHNRPGQDLQVRLQVFTLTGRVIKVIQKTINTAGNRSMELEWDGRDEFGDRVARGVYLYRLTVTAPDKKRKERIEKLVIF